MILTQLPYRAFLTIQDRFFFWWGVSVEVAVDVPVEVAVDVPVEVGVTLVGGYLVVAVVGLAEGRRVGGVQAKSSFT